MNCLDAEASSRWQRQISTCWYRHNIRNFNSDSPSVRTKISCSARQAPGYLFLLIFAGLQNSGKKHLKRAKRRKTERNDLSVQNVVAQNCLIQLTIPLIPYLSHTLRFQLENFTKYNNQTIFEEKRIFILLSSSSIFKGRMPHQLMRKRENKQNLPVEVLRDSKQTVIFSNHYEVQPGSQQVVPSNIQL